MDKKYTPNYRDIAIINRRYGFMFGGMILGVTSLTKLNEENKGDCYTGNWRGYDLLGEITNMDGDVSPLTNQMN